MKLIAVSILAIVVLLIFMLVKKSKATNNTPVKDNSTQPEGLDSFEILDPRRGITLSASINSNLASFKQKDYYPWECIVNIMYDCDPKTEMPTEESAKTLYPFFDKVNVSLRDSSAQPNAVLVSRIVGANMAECVWMVHDEIKAKETLNLLLESGCYAKGVEFTIQRDEEWCNYNFLRAKQTASETYIPSKIEQHFGDLKSLDISYSDPKKQEAVLRFVTCGFVDGSTYMQTALYDKIEGYLNHIQSSQFKSEYPEPNVVLEVSFDQTPSGLILQALDASRSWCKSNGATLRVKVADSYISFDKN